MTSPPGSGRWLNRNVLGMSLTSFFSDFGHEMATAVLPMFLATLGARAAALGTIEGVADAVASFVKLGGGWYSDRVGRRKPLVTLGYFLTGVAKASFALATAWPHLLWGRIVGWFGRGLRSPLRDAMLVESVTPAAYGRAFGFHRTADTLGAVVGPLLAFALVGWLTYRQIFWLTLIPGLLSVVAMVGLVKEPLRPRPAPVRLDLALAGLPAPFMRFLVGVGIFGVGDFAHTFLTLRASEVLAPVLGEAPAAQAAILLYTLHNVVYAGISYPIGSLADRVGKRGLLAMGYFCSAIMATAAILAPPRVGPLLAVFVLGGVVLGIQDALEGAIAADLLPERLRGTGYGLLSTVNGIGDLISSVVVGLLWAVGGPSATRPS